MDIEAIKQRQQEKEVTRIQFIGYTLMISAVVWLICAVLYWIFTKGCGC